MHITPNKEGLSLFEILYRQPYQIPSLRQTPAAEMGDTLTDKMETKDTDTEECKRENTTTPYVGCFLQALRVT